MNFENPTKQNTGTGDLDFLFDLNNPESFNEKLRRKNIDIVDRYIENGETIHKIQVPGGNILFVFGFRQLDLNEKRWFHTGSDNDIKHSKPFDFDINSPEFMRIKEIFKSKINENDNLLSVVNKLENIISNTVVSDMGYEDSMSLGDIIKKGRAACASKCTLAGSILMETVDGLRVEMIDGHLARLQDKVSMPFSHGWLRISDGTSCVLYDPMYHKIESYLFDTEIDENMIFSNYTVSAWPFATLRKIGLKTLLSGITAVKAYNGKNIELKIRPELSLRSQLGGQITGEVYIENGGILRLVNGSIETATSKNGPRLLYPLLDIEK